MLWCSKYLHIHVYLSGKGEPVCSANCLASNNIIHQLGFLLNHITNNTMPALGFPGLLIETASIIIPMQTLRHCHFYTTCKYAVSICNFNTQYNNTLYKCVCVCVIEGTITGCGKDTRLFHYNFSPSNVL